MFRGRLVSLVGEQFRSVCLAGKDVDLFERVLDDHFVFLCDEN